MTDILTKSQRSRMMSRIRARDTEPERTVRSVLHRLGYRFALCRRDLAGVPDIVLPRHRTIIFVHGCFWHRHKGCKYAYIPKSRTAFWRKKFRANVIRDEKVQRALRNDGWRVKVIWGCQTADAGQLMRRLKRIMEKKRRDKAHVHEKP